MRASRLNSSISCSHYKFGYCSVASGSKRPNVQTNGHVAKHGVGTRSHCSQELRVRKKARWINGGLANIARSSPDGHADIQKPWVLKRTACGFALTRITTARKPSSRN